MNPNCERCDRDEALHYIRTMLEKNIKVGDKVRIVVGENPSGTGLQQMSKPVTVRGINRGNGEHLSFLVEEDWFDHKQFLCSVEDMFSDKLYQNRQRYYDAFTKKDKTGIGWTIP